MLRSRARIAFVLVCCALVSVTAAAGDADDQSALLTKMQSLDAAVFDAFNHCDAPGRLAEHASYFARNVEFYHDTGGVTWTRAAMLKNTRKFVCGHFRRELIPESLRAYAIKDFGAMIQGTHQFCQFDTGRCDGLADFTILWRKQNEQWHITRVISYGHRTNEPTNR